MLQIQSVLGVFALLGIAWAMGERRRAVDVKAAVVGLAVTVGLAVLMLKSPWMAQAIGWINGGVDAVASATRAGTTFVFGYLGGGAPPFEVKTPSAQFIFAFQALPVILVVSALTSLLFHWRLLQPLVRAFSFLLRRAMGVGGAVGLSTAANIFLGMIEAPLFIRPYLARLTRSELFMVMTGGMAGIAGTVFVLYAQLLRPIVPDVSGHLLVASVLGAPAALLVSRLMVPEEAGAARDEADADIASEAKSAMDAIQRGAAAGLELLLSVIAMLIVLIALVWLGNAVLGLLPEIAGAPLSVQRLLGWLMAPVCWLMGVPWEEATAAGRLMGLKTAFNEMLAYLEFASLPAEAMSDRSRLIMTYALCGFANFGSLGILIAGMTSMAPERRADILGLGGKSLVAGTLATCLIGAIVGALH